MGAENFEHFRSGTDMQAAFREAVDEAAWEYGHGGYTGTIAEKHKVINRAPGRVFTLEEARVFAEKDAEDNDKWGPAFAIRVIDTALNKDGWLFYGYASS